MEKQTMKETAGTQTQVKNNPAAQADTIDLLELLYILWGRWYIIVASMLICGMIAFGYTRYMVTPLYQANAKIYIVSASNGSVVNISDLQIGTQLTGDYQELMKSRPLLEGIISKLGLNMNYRTLSGLISVTNKSGTRILNITATHSDPQIATNIANEMANQATVFLPQVMGTDAPNLVESAILPTSKASPNIYQNVIMGVMIGLVLSAGFFVVRFLLNDTFNDPDDVFKYLGIQPLATIPEVDLEAGRNSKKASAKKKTTTTTKGKVS